MIEILKFVLSGFWIFIGSISILYIILYFLVNGIIEIVKFKFDKMSSIYHDEGQEEIREEMQELEHKKSTYGWTKKDAERYRYLESLLD